MQLVRAVRLTEADAPDDQVARPVIVRPPRHAACAAPDSPSRSRPADLARSLLGRAGQPTRATAPVARSRPADLVHELFSRGRASRPAQPIGRRAADRPTSCATSARAGRPADRPSLRPLPSRTSAPTTSALRRGMAHPIEQLTPHATPLGCARPTAPREGAPAAISQTRARFLPASAADQPMPRNRPPGTDPIDAARAAAAFRREGNGSDLRGCSCAFDRPSPGAATPRHIADRPSRPPTSLSARPGATPRRALARPRGGSTNPA
jgi:hypothetical protein